MFVDAPESAARAILAAMWAVTRAGYGEQPDPNDRETIVAAGRIVFRPPLESVDPDDLDPVPPEHIAALLPPSLYVIAARLIGTAVLVDVDVDPDRLRLAVRYARALGQREAWIHDELEIARGHSAWARADILRHNTEGFARVVAAGGAAHSDAWKNDRENPAAVAAGDTAVVDTFFFPYTGRTAEDQALAPRFHELGRLSSDTFGRAFHDHYTLHNFRFPGEPHALAESFAVPHDSAHVLAGYSANVQGELLVSTFTGAVMGGDLMTTQLLPSILNDHLGADMHFSFGADRGWLEPRKFWVAWDRGAATTTNMFATDWDFWAAAPRPLSELRTEYDIPPLDPGDAAAGPDPFVTYKD